MPIHMHIHDWILTLDGTIASPTVTLWTGVHQGSVLGLLPCSYTIVWLHTAPTPLAKSSASLPAAKGQNSDILMPEQQPPTQRQQNQGAGGGSRVEATPLSINSREVEQLQVPGSSHDWEPDLDSDQHHHKNTDLQLQHCLVQQLLRPHQEVSTEHHQNRASIQAGTLRPERQEGGQLD